MPEPVILQRDSRILRAIDANLNRAREGLRVAEDYCRFFRDDVALVDQIKNIRHALAAATAVLAAEAVFFRDTPNDVGVDIKAAGELTRHDAEHVAVAACKRTGEALRVVEEFLKTIDPAAAAAVETTRYRFYDVERQIVLLARSPADRFAGVRLYVLITEASCKTPWLDAAAAAIRGGADCLQLREKSLDGGELLARARALAALCRQHGIVSIINDRVDIAALSDADGVHLGQTDLPPREARRLLGPRAIVGVSTHTLEQARQAEEDGANYIGVGPVFLSGTKPRNILPGLAFARAAAAAVRIPTVAIAGITRQNIGQVMGSGVQGVAVTAAVAACDDVEAAARQLRARVVAS